MSLRLKLIILFISLAIGEGVLIGYRAYSDSIEIVNTGKKREMANTVNRIDINITSKIRHINSVLESAANNEIIHNACLNSTEENLSSLNRYVKAFIENTIKYSSDEINIFILNSENDILFNNTNSNSSNKTVPKQYNEFIKNPKSTQIAGSNTAPHNIIITKEIFIKDKSTGFIIIELPSVIFADLLLGNQGLFRYQYLFILDTDGSLICNVPNIDMDWSPYIYEQFNKGIRSFEFKWHNKLYYACGQHNGITGWSTYSVIQSSNLFSHKNAIGSSILFTVIMVAFFTALLVIIISYSLTTPIYQLSKTMTQIQNGELNQRISSKRKDEIGKLERTFDFMLDKIEFLINQVYRKDIAQKNAELSALHAQINPHFLYNTLDTINWMLIEKNEFQVSELILSLADILRYSIGDGKQMVNMETELRYVNNYLNIQKSRFEDKLSYCIDIEENAKNAAVPKLLFQPLIENSIQHGIEPGTKHCTIKIFVKKIKDMLTIIISDDGAGIEKNKLSGILNRLKTDNYEFSSQNIGLVNVNRRMKLYFENNYFFNITSKKNEGTSIFLRFPYMKEVPDENNNC